MAQTFRDLAHLRARLATVDVAASKQSRRRINHRNVTSLTYVGNNGYGDECYDLSPVKGRTYRVYIHHFVGLAKGGAMYRAICAISPMSFG